MVVWGDGLTLDAGDGAVILMMAIILEILVVILKILVVRIILVIWGVWRDLVGVTLVVVGKILMGKRGFYFVLTKIFDQM